MGNRDNLVRAQGYNLARDDLLSYLRAQQWGRSKFSMIEILTYSCKVLVIYTFHQKSSKINLGR